MRIDLDGGRKVPSFWELLAHVTKMITKGVCCIYVMTPQPRECIGGGRYP